MTGAATRTSRVGKSLLAGGMAGAVVGLAVALPLTVADWRLNPSGIFHSAGATHWTVVLETAWSWFAPVALLTFAFVAGAWYVLAGRKCVEAAHSPHIERIGQAPGPMLESRSVLLRSLGAIVAIVLLAASYASLTQGLYLAGIVMLLGGAFFLRLSTTGRLFRPEHGQATADEDADDR